MANKTKELGDKGEAIAKEYLEKLGYIFLEANYHCRDGEIDLIFRDKDVLVFVEVKTRTDEKWMDLEETISQTKINKILKTAEYYIDRQTEKYTEMRIDAVFIISRIGECKVKHYRNFV